MTSIAHIVESVSHSASLLVNKTEIGREMKMKPRRLVMILAAFAGTISITFVLYTLQIKSHYVKHGLAIALPSINNIYKSVSSRPHRKGPIYFGKEKEPKFGCKYSNLEPLTELDSTESIPKIIHWIYVDQHVPEQYKVFMQHCQKINPDHDFIFWSDATALAFIKRNYPGYLYLFHESFKEGLEFTDALRYFILLHFGGVYIDLDVECRIPFSQGLKPYSCIIDREREAQTRLYWGNEFSAMNSVMACKRGHPFFQEAVDKLKISAKNEKGILARTGPAFLTTHYLKYKTTDLFKSKPVILAPSTLFSPLMDVNHIPMFQSICQGNLKNDWQRKGCAEFRRNGYSHGNVAELTKSSVAIHRYLHLGWGSWKHQIRRRLDACKLAQLSVFTDG